MTTNNQILLNNLERLGLNKIREYLPNYLDQIHTDNLSLTEALIDLTNSELQNRHEGQIARAIGRARFPNTKSLDTFDLLAIRESVKPTWQLVLGLRPVNRAVGFSLLIVMSC